MVHLIVLRELRFIQQHLDLNMNTQNTSSLLQARKALVDRQKDLELKTQQLEIKLSSKVEEDIKKARRKSTQAGEYSFSKPLNRPWQYKPYTTRMWLPLRAITERDTIHTKVFYGEHKPNKQQTWRSVCVCWHLVLH